MTRHSFVCSAVVALVLAAGLTSTARAQQPQSVPTLKVDIVLTRYQGDKKTSSLPFTVYVNSNNYASLRLGVDVPIGTSTVTSGNENSNPTGRSTTSTSTSTTATKVDYRNIGTSIDARASQLPDGRFNLDLRVQDSSVFTKDADGKMPVQTADPAAFRTLTFSNTLPMRDGQTMLWATGTDKITGETLKIDVTLTVVK